MAAKPGPNPSYSIAARNGSKLEAKFRHALDLHQQDKRQQAAKLYRAVLKSQPLHVGALHYMGMLSHQQGDSEVAVELIGKAIAQKPDYFDALMNMGNVLQEMDRFTEANDYYDKAIKLKPKDASALSNYGVNLRRQDRMKEAIEMGRSAVKLDPEYVLTWYNLGNTYKVAKDFKQAIVSYQHAIEIKPDLGIAHNGLCEATFQQEYQSLLGKLSFAKTRKAYQQWLKYEPDNALPAFMLQALNRNNQLKRMPDSVVSSMFDQFSDSFEQQLQKLDYSLPKKMTSMLQNLLGEPKAALRIVDGGCGTGLCGPALKPWASHLTGVDLSSGMLDKARKKDDFDALLESELSLFLQQHKSSFDLAVFADTLIYFGDLQEVLSASANALEKEGRLLFTLEACKSNGGSTGYELHPNGRYTHSANYVKKTLQACGFGEINIYSDSMRQEIGKAVDGLVVSAQKL